MKCRDCNLVMTPEGRRHVCASCGRTASMWDAADCAGPSSLTKPGLAVQLGVKKRDASGLFAELES